MLPTDARMRNSAEFKNVVSKGNRLVGRYVIVYLKKDHQNQPRPSRVGFVVSKKVGNAVIRNRVKRCLRHCMREFLVNIPPNTDVVIRALPSCADNQHMIKTDLKTCLDRILVRYG